MKHSIFFIGFGIGGVVFRLVVDWNSLDNSRALWINLVVFMLGVVFLAAEKK